MTIKINSEIYIDVVEYPRHLIPAEELEFGLPSEFDDDEHSFQQVGESSSVNSFSVHSDDSSVSLLLDDDGDDDISIETDGESTLLHFFQFADGLAPWRSQQQRNERRRALREASDNDSIELANGRGIRRLAPRPMNILDGMGDDDSVSRARDRGIPPLTPYFDDEVSSDESDDDSDDDEEFDFDQLGDYFKQLVDDDQSEIEVPLETPLVSGAVSSYIVPLKDDEPSQSRAAPPQRRGSFMESDLNAFARRHGREPRRVARRTSFNEQPQIS